MIRQKQRRVAFQLIYSLQYQGTEQAAHVLQEFYSQQENPERIPYIDDTVSGVCAHWNELNAMIAPALKNWKPERVSAVCMAILRLAAYEIHFNPAIPNRVAVNEAIELAKQFGEEDSGAFVHGVLGKIAAE